MSGVSSSVKTAKFRKRKPHTVVVSPEIIKPKENSNPHNIVLSIESRSGRGVLGTILLQLFRSLVIPAVAVFIFYHYNPSLPSLCFIPGLCASQSNPRLPMWADFHRIGRIQTDSFDSLLASGLGGYKLVGFVTRAEMAANNLVTAVRVSELKARDVLADKLAEFARDASTTGDELQGLHEQIIGAADR